MTVHNEAFECAFPEWRPLIAACNDYARLTGWRFVLSDFMNLSQRCQSPELCAARELALPMSLEYGDRVRACIAATAEGAHPPRLLEEFMACQRLVSTEAVYNSMLATIKAVGLGEAGTSEATAEASELEGDALAFQDMSQPIQVIATRLTAYDRWMQANGLQEERQQRLLQSSFIVEFGLEHGLPEMRDATSAATLTDFMSRLGEWEGAQGDAGELVRSLVLESIPAGPAQQPLRTAVLDWANKHKGQALIGGAIVGGVLGVLVTGAAIAVASSVRRR